MNSLPAFPRRMSSACHRMGRTLLALVLASFGLWDSQLLADVSNSSLEAMRANDSQPFHSQTSTYEEVTPAKPTAEAHPWMLSTPRLPSDDLKRVQSPDDSFAERLASLEDKFEEVSESYRELQEQHDDLQESLQHYVQSGHEQSALEVSGRMHIDHWAFPGDSPGVNAFETGAPTITPQDRLGFRRLRLGVRGDLWKNMLYKLEMEFAEGQDPEFRDAYLGWKELPIFQTLLVGNQKRPYGLDHVNSSRFNVFIERPFIIESFNQDARRLGIVSYGVSRNESWNWRCGVYNMRLVQDEGTYSSDHYQLEFAARLANTIWYDEWSGGRGYAHWGLSGTIANPDGTNNGSALPPNPFGRADNEARFRTRPEARTESRWLDTGVILGADNYELLGCEGVLNIGPCQLVGEYQHVWLQRFGGNELSFHGGYAYVSYFLTGEHIPWDRASGTIGRVTPYENFFLVNTCTGRVGGGCGAWQVALRWSYADLTDLDVRGGVGESVTCGINWYWNPYARLQFNYIYGDIHDRAPVANQTFGSYHIVGTRFSIDF